MRTTVTIDADTAALLQEEVARTGLSFKEVLNRAVRRALGRPAERIRVEPVFQYPFPTHLGSFNRLADELDDEDTIRELQA
ncbi:MAG: ribbon-helix-helix protein, CopG family [Candidatus Eremiobacteraeota bacterium]|nr:ribbon-helix-helix protein, CopG family [Candidatus Eremiobacteraeota bacterium]MCW5870836.1 ribbon-helix-helix protein, CopG family [Candidatus Eremiobacteraeota bacterium]